ncbi:PH domain-containing protein [Nocardioides sp. zg-536]|uniref:PH domain-containing protein n=1 Tax=Nocardioides faecalis TaxID=2803858 RepID=A0A939BUY6_9ACTN|nr:PH domain-containing protein [Nocardioides faecalis]MBM9459371.1 PH domain-containing protein [Nocardioides faecalis]QVI59518.1 PH domain-containing protein [Nocardioides faecalis]
MTWERLDRRMLLVHPVKELIRFAPALIAVLVAGSSRGFGGWSLIGVAAPITLGVVRYLTTTYRITADRVELRRGLLHRHQLSAPIDRVRTVDLTASPVHRLLGLATVVIGTGSAVGDEERLELDALSRDQAAALRERLLRAAGAAQAPEPTAPWPAPDGAITTPPAPTAPGAAAAPEVVLARFSASWLWYAPFSGALLVVLGASAGVLNEVAEFLELRVREPHLGNVSSLPLVALALAVLLLAVLVSVVGYALVNGGFVLARQGATWHLRRGLLTRRETSIDTARLAGVRLGEPAALRAVRGRRLTAIVTGLTGAHESSTVLLPPVPATVALEVMAGVLGNAEPVVGPLATHGRTARTRRFTRAGLAALPVAVGIAAAVVLLDAGPWLLLAAVAVLVLAVLLAADRWRALGHAHLAGHVVMRSGSVRRGRDVLEDSHVIGWNLDATWFQRRAGLVTLSATTAGGGGRIHVPDVPVPAALALAEAATPGLLTPFLVENQASTE